ncbi:hypothetical protein [Pseudalkalibacillus caeni]|uniref:Group-specific protein n=1 Tax=Exobacillus caeni TaxID=2574798 RepID=A0A5R9F9L7_9BACL|nr:hypothetical protein [Pseudalkalibacillus caeni]TLS38956.1 hypothetical protein FCL54_01195 [Pseudalkalibacillus caeni]
MQTFAIIVIVFLVIMSLVGTLMIGGKSDRDYMNRSKKNTLTISFIYVVSTFIFLGILGIYMYLT